MAIIAERLDEDDVDLSGLLLQQNDGNDESDTKPIVTIEEHLTFPGKMMCYKIQFQIVKKHFYGGVHFFKHNFDGGGGL